MIIELLPLFPADQGVPSVRAVPWFQEDQALPAHREHLGIPEIRTGREVPSGLGVPLVPRT